jgi:hypothetical protein
MILYSFPIMGSECDFDCGTVHKGSNKWGSKIGPRFSFLERTFNNDIDAVK